MKPPKKIKNKYFKINLVDSFLLHTFAPVIKQQTNDNTRIIK